MKHYFISKDKYNGEVIYLNCDPVNGYKITPKNNIPYEGIMVNEMVIVKPSLAEKIIKRKIKNKIDLYLKLIIDNLDGSSSSDDTRKALGDVERYKHIINEKYAIYLDNKYISLLNKKMDVIERELKSNLIYLDMVAEKEYNEELEASRTR